MQFLTYFSCVCFFHAEVTRIGEEHGETKNSKIKQKNMVRESSNKEAFAIDAPSESVPVREESDRQSKSVHQFSAYENISSNSEVLLHPILRSVQHTDTPDVMSTTSLSLHANVNIKQTNSPVNAPDDPLLRTLSTPRNPLVIHPSQSNSPIDTPVNPLLNTPANILLNTLSTLKNPSIIRASQTNFLPKAAATPRTSTLNSSGLNLTSEYSLMTLSTMAYSNAIKNIASNNGDQTVVSFAPKHKNASLNFVEEGSNSLSNYGKAPHESRNKEAMHQNTGNKNTESKAYFIASLKNESELNNYSDNKTELRQLQGRAFKEDSNINKNKFTLTQNETNSNSKGDLQEKLIYQIIHTKMSKNDNGVEIKPQFKAANDTKLLKNVVDHKLTKNYKKVGDIVSSGEKVKTSNYKYPLPTLRRVTNNSGYNPHHLYYNTKFNSNTGNHTLILPNTYGIALNKNSTRSKKEENTNKITKAVYQKQISLEENNVREIDNMNQNNISYKYESTETTSMTSTTEHYKYSSITASSVSAGTDSSFLDTTHMEDADKLQHKNSLYLNTPNTVSPKLTNSQLFIAGNMLEINSNPSSKSVLPVQQGLHSKAQNTKNKTGDASLETSTTVPIEVLTQHTLAEPTLSHPFQSNETTTETSYYSTQFSTSDTSTAETSESTETTPMSLINQRVPIYQEIAGTMHLDSSIEDTVDDYKTNAEEETERDDDEQYLPNINGSLINLLDPLVGGHAGSYFQGNFIPDRQQASYFSVHGNSTSSLNKIYERKSYDFNLNNKSKRENYYQTIIQQKGKIFVIFCEWCSKYIRKIYLYIYSLSVRNIKSVLQADTCDFSF